MSKIVRLKLAQLVVDHITLLVFVLQHVPTKETRVLFLQENVRLAPMLWGVQCSIHHVMVGLSKKSNKIKTRRTSKILLRFQSRVWREVAILDGRATKTVSGFMSVQPIADQYEGTAIETTDVGFTFAGGGTEAASTKICIPHAGLPQGVSVNVASNESTPFLIGLDVLREYGLVIDYHCNRVYSHILKRTFLVQFFRHDILLWR